MSQLEIGTLTEGGEKALLDSAHLTTHAVCLGMTGSGKTGLGIVVLEELAASRIPLLIIDLKGDMVDLLLNFPDFNPRDFEAWLPPEAAGGGDRKRAAEAQAALWKKGLAKSGIDGARMRRTRDGLRWRLLTPGRSSGAPLDILPSLSAPPDWKPGSDPDGTRQRVDGLTSALLSLIDRGGDPLSDPDHVLLASIILEKWRRLEQLDLGSLLAAVMDPPINRLGALPLETFYPREKRMKLVMALNTLLASPSFQAWTEGLPLDMNILLGTPDDPCGTIVSLAHLDEKQRLFCLTLLASELVSWMRGRAASQDLSALMYIDEVQGILPPHPANPPTKHPLLTLLKQGRAFGVGLWLATQNPVDLDYKALGNAGVKVIGRLITERDRERALEGLGLSGTEEGRAIEARVSRLDKREFVLHDVRASERVRVFSSRWAMSYLRGPVTLAEMKPLLQRETKTSDGVAETASPQPVRPAASNRNPRPPVLGVEIRQVYAPSGGELRPALLVENGVSIMRKSLNLDRSLEEYWRIPIDERGEILWEEAEKLETAPEVFEEPPEDAFFPAAAPPHLGSELKGIEKKFIRWRARSPLKVLGNLKLKCAAETGESREEFIERCREKADQADDARQASVRRRYERKIESVKRRLDRERDELDRDRTQLEARKAEEKLGVVEGLFSVLLGSRSLRTAAGKAGSKLRSASSKRRMRQRAEGAVVESEHEIEALESDLEELAAEMQDEIDAIAEASDRIAEGVEEVGVRAKQADVLPRSIRLYWC